VKILGGSQTEVVKC